MTSQPIEPRPGAGPDADAPAGAPGGDLGVGGPADQAGPADEAQTPPGYPERVDPSEGPLAGREDTALGDLGQPGADR
jgi:hypothetical protein